MEKCRTIPLRLTPRERKLLAVLESALNVSEYTDKVDTVSRQPKADRIVQELEHLFATILGLMICCEPQKGVELVRRNVKENEAFFREIFEVVRSIQSRTACVCVARLCRKRWGSASLARREP